MRRRRTTDAQIAYVIDVTTRRREAYAKVREQFPTNAELAEELHLCQRMVERIAAGEYVPRGTSVRPTTEELYNELKELGVA